ncbi:MAG: hypothetical protein K2K84_06540 [Muribaculaceae bacterium]|nr:hypothetical protein [Muribaculaceae bacterium]
MKKSLLLGLLALSGLSMTAQTVDDFKYEVKDGVKLENLWLYARNYGNWNTENLPFVEDWDRVRTATIAGDKIYLGYSHKIMVGDELNSGSAHYGVVDLKTGKYEKTVQVTVDGNTVDGLLASNQIGTDDFGHVWFCAFVADLVHEGTVRDINVYVIDDLDKGTASLAFTVNLPEDETEAGASRVDYYDLVGDVTGKEAGTVFMCASCENATAPYIYGWQRDQGSNKWEPHMADNGYVAQELGETYPAGQIILNYGSMLKIVRDEEHSGNLFYVDGYTTYPTLYDTSGSMLESFATCADTEGLLPDDVGCNGVAEFNIKGNDYICYPINQYNKGLGWELRIAKLGDGQSFTGMTPCWTFPEKGQGTLTDAGMRIHSLMTAPVKDSEGHEGVYLMQYKCNGGLGVYLVADENFKAGVNDIVADTDNSNAPVEYFNLNGVKVNGDLAPGLYIKRQGSAAEKVVVK